MSTFITKSDYSEFIRTNILDSITNATDGILDAAEVRSIELMKGYLNARYDTTNIFNKTGDDRNPVVVMYCIDLILFDIHSRINPRKIPELRIERRNIAIDWLEKVQQLLINPPDLPVIEGEKNYIIYGSEPKRNNYI